MLPKIVSPRALAFLWLLLGLCGLAGALSWFVQIPIYVSGTAIVVDGASASLLGSPRPVVLAAFFPPDALSHMQVGHPLWLEGATPRERMNRPLVAVETEILSPEAALQRFGAAAALTRPVVVAFTAFEPSPGGLAPSNYLGSRFQAQVQMGTQRLPSLLLPATGRPFGD